MSEISPEDMLREAYAKAKEMGDVESMILAAQVLASIPHWVA